MSNLELRCKSHNAYEADLYYGPREPEGMIRETAAGYRTVAANTQLGPDRVESYPLNISLPRSRRGAHSSRRTTTGSTRIACRAGTYEAAAATIKRISVTPRNTTGSVGGTP